MNLSQPPEGILDPQQPWWPTKNIGERLWMQFKAKLTGNKMPDGTQYTSYIRVTEADADRIIENIKKYGQYPQVNQGGKDGGYSNIEAYQKWIVEEFLEKPFREQVDKKIEERQIESRLKEIQETKKEVKEAETKEEVAAVIDDKIEVLEEIREHVAPPRSEYQIPDPWEGSYTTPKSQATAKKTKKRVGSKGSGRPKGTLKKTRKKKASAGAPPPNPPGPKKTFASKFGGGLRKTGQSLGKSLIDKLEGGAPLGENMGPSVLGAGIWMGKKITKAFQDAKKERARAVEAEQNGAEVPPEMKERGYFIKKSLAHQFGGEALNKTVGAFFENIPSKQSSKKAGFGDKFDYGDGDPKKKKQQNDIKDLATGFRKVTSALRGINKSISQQIGLMSKLVGETSRVADTLEAIQNAIAKQIDVEIQTDADDTQAQQATGGDINIGDIDLGGLGGKEGGLDWFDLLMGADDIRDIKKNMTNRGGQRTTTRKPRITGDVKPRSRFRMPSFGRRMKFSEGAASVGTQVPALIGEAGPEMLIRGAPKKLAEGGVMQGAGSNILATGLGAAGDLMKKVQPFANVMEMPFKVIGSQISGALASLVSAAGPFSGVIAKMFSPLLGGLATIFGLNQGAFASELNSAAMTEREGAKELSKFFASFFKLFGLKLGGDKGKTTAGDKPPGYVPIDWKQDPAFGEAVNKVAQHFDISASDLMGLMASESGLRPDADNGSHVGLIQFSATSAAAAGTTQADLKKMSRAEQMPYVQKYLENAKLPKGASAGQLYTAVFLPAFVGKPDDFVIASADGSQPEGYPESKSWYRSNQGLDMNNDDELTIQELGERIQKKKKEFNIPMVKGGAMSIASNFSNQVQGVFEMDGPDTGYKVPEDLTGGQSVIGHGLEWLIKMSNKFIILPGINKEYNVYQDPEKALKRYEQIGNQAGVEVAGLVDLMDKMIFGGPKRGPSNLQYGGGAPRRTYRTDGSPEAAEIMRLLGGTPVKGASLPEGTITPVAIPKDTVTGTTGAVIAMIQPMIQYVPVPVPGPSTVEYVPANPFIAAKTGIEMIQLQGLS